MRSSASQPASQPANRARVNPVVEILNACLANDLASIRELAANGEPAEDLVFKDLSKEQRNDALLIVRQIASAVLAKGDSRAALDRAISEIQAKHGNITNARSKLSVTKKDLRAFAASIYKEGLRGALETARGEAARALRRMVNDPFQSEGQLLENVRKPASALRWIKNLQGNADSPSPLELLISADVNESLGNRVGARSISRMTAERSSGMEDFSHSALTSLAALCNDMRGMRRVLLEQQQLNGGQSRNETANRIDSAIKPAKAKSYVNGVLDTLAVLANPDWEKNDPALYSGGLLCSRVIESLYRLNPGSKDQSNKAGIPDRAIQIVLRRLDGSFTDGVVRRFMEHKYDNVQFPQRGAIVYEHGFDELGPVDGVAQVQEYYSDRETKWVDERFIANFCKANKANYAEYAHWTAELKGEYAKQLEEVRKNPPLPKNEHNHRDLMAHCKWILEQHGEVNREIVGVQIIVWENVARGSRVHKYKIALR